MPTRIGRVVSRPRSQVGEQLGDHGRVLGAAFDQSQRMLGPVDTNTQCDNAQVRAEVNAVNHQRHQVQVPQRRGEQLGQRSLGHRHEPARDRRLARRRSRALDLLTDRFEPDPVATAREATEHFAHRHPAQDLAAAEQVIGRHGHLTAVSGTHPRPLDPDSTPAQGDRPALTTVAHRSALRVVFAARSARRGDVGLHQRGHHLQAGADGEGEQALTHVIGDLAHRYRHYIRYGEPWPGTRLRRVLLVLVGHGGPLLGGVLADAQHLPHGRCQAGDRHSNSTRPGTTSDAAATEVHGVLLGE